MSQKTGKNKARDRLKKRQDKQKKFLRYQESLRSSILTFDEPILKKVCDTVNKTDDRSFIDRMKKVLSSTNTGLGLAASQIGFPYRVAIMRSDVKDKTFKVLINPVIVDFSDETIRGEEGCLSYPGVVRIITRSFKIKVQYKDENFRSTEESFSGLESRIICHEIDHMNGICKLAAKVGD